MNDEVIESLRVAENKIEEYFKKNTIAVNEQDLICSIEVDMIVLHKALNEFLGNF